MGWGLELWDKETETKAFVSEGINFIEKARNFAVELSKLESSFAGQFKKLVRMYFPATPDDVYAHDHVYRVCKIG